MSYSELVKQATRREQANILIIRLQFAGVMMFLTGLAMLVTILILG